jgi:ATP adenylyltransferase
VEQLWAPWRMEVVGKGDAVHPQACIFCTLPAAPAAPGERTAVDRQNLILGRTANTFAILNRYPYNNGHLMVAPFAHVDTPAALPPEALTEMMQLANVCLAVLQETMHPDGANLGMNLGKSAGAGIKDHIHLHIVPRWTGDTNFMPVFGDTRVIVESLDHCYAHLKPLFDAQG